MTNHQGDESTLILDFDIANSAQTEYCSTFHFPSVPPWPLGPLGPMDHMDNLDILHNLDHSHRSNHFDNPDWSMIDQEDNCRIRVVYLVLLSKYFVKSGQTLNLQPLLEFMILSYLVTKVGANVGQKSEIVKWKNCKIVAASSLNLLGANFMTIHKPRPPCLPKTFVEKKQPTTLCPTIFQNHLLFLKKKPSLCISR